MIVIVGLGNPGEGYKDTRHNIGATVVKSLGRKLGVRFRGRGFQSRYVISIYKREALVLVCPLTYMNRSGLAVKAFVGEFELELSNLLVVHDDLDLPVGRLKVVRRGGAGGHKGIQSVIGDLGSDSFPRLKIGIGRPRFGEPIEEFVLSPFYNDEKAVMEKVRNEAVRACELFVSLGVEAAMNRVNCQNLADKEVAN